MALTIMGQSPKKAAVYVLMVGGTATAAKFAGDALGDRLFVQTADDAAAHPRDADQQKMIQLYRGLATIAAGALVGKVLWKSSRPIAFGLAAGFTVSGIDRIATVYDVKRQIVNLFRASDSQIAAPATGTVPSYNAGAILLLGDGSQRSYTGPIVARERIAMRAA